MHIDQASTRNLFMANSVSKKKKILSPCVTRIEMEKVIS